MVNKFMPSASWCVFLLSVSQISLSTLYITFWVEPGLTDEAEDVSDGGDEDDQHVVEGQDGGGDQHVASPAELSTAEQQSGDGGADLGKPQSIDVLLFGLITQNQTN